jgi:hypothetical protein
MWGEQHRIDDSATGRRSPIAYGAPVAAPVQVLHIAGLGRSGSTILGAVLGQLDGFFYVGELFQTGRRLAEGEPCGCGAELRACPTWQAVLAAAFPERRGAADPSLVNFAPRDGSVRGLLEQRLRRHRLLPAAPRLERQSEAFGAVLRAIPAVTGANVVVDSSKKPGFGEFLRGLHGVDVAVVHLVRDPRAVAHSRLRTGERRGKPLRPGPRGIGLVWNAWNAAIELSGRRGRYARLRYEDFVERPLEAVRRVAALAGETEPRLALTSPHTVVLEPTHTVAGNRSRFRTGEVPLRADREWRTAGRLSPADRRILSAVTWPLRARYGYGDR